MTHEHGTPLSRRAGFAWFVVTVVAFAAVAFRTEVQAKQIIRNQHRIVQIQYDQCSLRNEGVVRQNGLLDAAVAAERRRATPDQRRIRDLQQFKTAVADCGPAPA